MKWLRAFRRSTIFVDVLLVLGAIVAIMGLSMFVHFNAKKTLSTTELEQPVAYAEQTEANTVADPPTENTSPDNKTSQPDASTKSTALPASSTPVTSTVAKVCDNIKKAQLTSKYNSDVASENNAFNKSVLGLSVLTPVYKNLYNLHQATLGSLLSNLNGALAAINC